jgi:hypothetical protein
VHIWEDNTKGVKVPPPSLSTYTLCGRMTYYTSKCIMAMEWNLPPLNPCQATNQAESGGVQARMNAWPTQWVVGGWGVGGWINQSVHTHTRIDILYLYVYFNSSLAVYLAAGKGFSMRHSCWSVCLGFRVSSFKCVSDPDPDPVGSNFLGRTDPDPDPTLFREENSTFTHFHKWKRLSSSFITCQFRFLYKKCTRLLVSNV